MGADISVTAEDVKRWVKEKKLTDEIVRTAMDNPETAAELADDIADEISDYLEDDPEFKKRLMEVALKNPTFKKRVVSAIAAELND